MDSSLITQRVKQYPIALLAAFLGIILLGWGYFMRQPRVNELELQLQELETTRNLYASNIRNAHNLEADNEELEQAIERIEDRLMDGEAFGENLAFFYDFGRTHGARSILPRPTDSGVPLNSKEFEKLGFTLNVEAPWPDIVNFLYDLNNNAQYFVRPVRFSFAMGGEGSFSSSVVVDVLARKKKG